MSDIDSYPLGTVVDVFGEWDIGVTPTDPAAVTLTVQGPSGAEVAYTYPASPVIKTGTGRYKASLTPATPGMWHYRWAGVGLADGAREGQFYIEQSFVGTDVYTYDPAATDIGRVRLHIDDRDFTKVNVLPYRLRSAIFTDPEIQAFLDQAGGIVLMAASLALTAIASNRVLLVQRRQIGKTDVDYGSLRSDLLRNAQSLREQAIIIGVDVMAPADGIVEHVWDDFSLRRVIANEAARNL